MIELILGLPFEGHVLILGTIIAGIIHVMRTPNKERSINPFEQTTQLTDKQIKSLQEHNDR
jgi:hypothetical protein